MWQPPRELAVILLVAASAAVAIGSKCSQLFPGSFYTFSDNVESRLELHCTRRNASRLEATVSWELRTGEGSIPHLKLLLQCGEEQVEINAGNDLRGESSTAIFQSTDPDVYCTVLACYQLSAGITIYRYLENMSSCPVASSPTPSPSPEVVFESGSAEGSGNDSSFIYIVPSQSSSASIGDTVTTRLVTPSLPASTGSTIIVSPSPSTLFLTQTTIFTSNSLVTSSFQLRHQQSSSSLDSNSPVTSSFQLHHQQPSSSLDMAVTSSTRSIFESPVSEEATSTRLMKGINTQFTSYSTTLSISPSSTPGIVSSVAVSTSQIIFAVFSSVTVTAVLIVCAMVTWSFFRRHVTRRRQFIKACEELGKTKISITDITPSPSLVTLLSPLQAVSTYIVESTGSSQITTSSTSDELSPLESSSTMLQLVKDSTDEKTLRLNSSSSSCSDGSCSNVTMETLVKPAASKIPLLSSHHQESVIHVLDTSSGSNDSTVTYCISETGEEQMKLSAHDTECDNHTHHAQLTSNVLPYIHTYACTAC